MSSNASRLPSRLPINVTAMTNEISAGQQALTISKLQRPSSLDTKLKLPSAGIKNLTFTHPSSTQHNVEPTRLRKPLKLNNRATQRNENNFTSLAGMQPLHEKFSHQKNLFHRKKIHSLNLRSRNLSPKKTKEDELRVENFQLRIELEKLRNEKNMILAEKEKLQAEKMGLTQEI
ncbi:16259_t:CDS:2, partial [Acaulospora morrowiae]